MKNNAKKPTTSYAYLVLIALVILIAVGLVIFDAPIQTMFFLGWLVIIPAAMKLGYSYQEVMDAAFDFCRRAMQPSFIILAVGALVGTWIAAGTVPTLIYSGLAIVTPKYFLLTTLILCSLTSLATGTSWGTMGTAGLAMMGVGAGLGVPAPITAGAVISGAYFGDKMSPLSDSTNLAAAVTEGDLMKHVKHMFYDQIPSYIITAVIFVFIGFKYSGGTVDSTHLNSMLDGLANNFNIGIIAFIPAIILIALLVMKKPPIISILIAAIVGGIIAVLHQGESFNTILSAFYSGYSSNTGIDFLDTLLNRGGVTSMFGTLSIMLFGFGLAGMMNEVGIMEALLEPLTKKVNSLGKLVVVSMIVNYASNMIGASMSFASVMTGTLLTPVYKEWNLKPENLSRIIEASGTLGAPLIPWNSNAIYASAMLGVSPIAYLPYCFLNYITPLIDLFYGFTGISMTYYEEDSIEAAS
ncbi:MAG: Na+/H+ antiporter NhaC [Bacillota bacterium]